MQPVKLATSITLAVQTGHARTSLSEAPCTVSGKQHAGVRVGDSHGRRHIPHLLEVLSVEGVLAQSTQHGDEHLDQEHADHQHIHVLLQLCHLYTKTPLHAMGFEPVSREHDVRVAYIDTQPGTLRNSILPRQFMKYSFVSMLQSLCQAAVI